MANQQYQSFSSKNVGRVAANRSKFAIPVVSIFALAAVGLTASTVLRTQFGYKLAKGIIKTKAVNTEEDLKQYDAEFAQFTKELNNLAPPKNSVF